MRDEPFEGKNEVVHAMSSSGALVCLGAGPVGRDGGVQAQRAAGLSLGWTLRSLPPLALPTKARKDVLEGVQPRHGPHVGQPAHRPGQQSVMSGWGRRAVGADLTLPAPPPVPTECGP